MPSDPDSTAQFPRAADQRLLGIEPDLADSWSFIVGPQLCRADGRFYGGAALAAALVAGESATGRASLWSTTQLVGSAELGERIRVRTEVVASGRTVDQVQVRGTAGDRLVFSAVGATASPRPDGMRGTGPTMPLVPPPESCESWMTMGPPGDGPAVGHHLVSDVLRAPLLDARDERPDRMAMWARLSGECASVDGVLTPAAMGFLADMVPLAVSRACGVEGAGTSLDNTLRLGDFVPAEWVLLDLEAHAAAGGFGSGHAHLWSPDGHLVASASQTARLFSFEEFLIRSGLVAAATEPG